MPAPDDRSDQTPRYVTHANWMRPDLMHRSFQHVEQVVPTTTVDRGPGPVSELPTELADLSGFTFVDHTGETRTLDSYLEREHVDALIVWRNGKIRQEVYRNGQTRRSRHIVFSVTKSFTGLLAEMLIEEGALDDRRLVSDLVAELGRPGGAYADATVRHVLDMEVGIDFTEIYDDPQSDIRQFSYASGFRATPPDVTAHRSLYDYLPTLRKRGDHGVDFHYVTANSEVLGWAIEAVTGTPIAELLEERIYAHVGAERDAFYITDPLGKAVAGGGMCVTAPDLLRLALLVAHDGVWNGRRLVPEPVIARLKAGGTPRPSLWGNEGGGSDFSYRSQWYTHHSGRVLYASGIHGQNIYLSTEHDSAMVLHSSNPDADGEFFAVGAAYFAAITGHLASA
jgi:CubicO group peptidase (beta-lactamase class C family)